MAEQAIQTQKMLQGSFETANKLEYLHQKKHLSFLSCSIISYPIISILYNKKLPASSGSVQPNLITNNININISININIKHNTLTIQ